MSNDNLEKKNIAAVSNIGCRRHNNEDMAYSGSTQYGTLLVVADGMGGHRKGEVASKEVVDILSITFASNRHRLSSSSAKRMTKKAIKKANKNIYKMSFATGEFEEMGTTVVAALRGIDGTYVINLGDSRCYSYSQDSGLVRQTIDQSYVELLYENGRISKKEMQSHPQKNMLINAVGINPDVSEIQDKIIDNSSYSILLLCSDGLYNMVSDEDIAKVLSDKGLDVQAKADTLIKMALDAGGNDNIAVSIMGE